MLKVKVKEYEDFHQVHIPMDILAKIVAYCDYYMPQRKFPDKAIDVLDLSCVSAKASNTHQVNEEMVKDVVEKLTAIPLASVDRVQLLKAQLQESLIGQEEVIDKLNDKSQDIKRVAVVGAGYIGVELAEAFQRHGKEVILIDVVDTCLAGYYDHDLTELMAKNMESHGIKLAFGETVKAVEGETKVERIVTDKNAYDVDMVVLAVGFRPNTALGAGKLETFRNGAYLVNKKQETSIKDVYAVGDCATVYDNALDDVNYIALASNAVRSGIVGGHNAGGGDVESNGVQGSNGISIYGLNMVSTGLTEEKAKRFGFNPAVVSSTDLQKAAFMEDENADVTIKIVYDKDTRKVLGAQMVSRMDISMGIHMFSLAIQEGVTIDRLQLLDLFFLPHFNQPLSYIAKAAISAK